MTRSVQRPFTAIQAKPALVFVAAMFALVVAASQVAQAQTFQILHNFSGGRDGANPLDGLTIDQYGNLYGTTSAGGYQVYGCNGSWGSTGCGGVFELARVRSNWIFRPLYDFQGGNDSGNPGFGVVFGPDGALYGLTGGGGGCTSYYLCGSVYRLRPPPNFCGGVTCSWQETVLHQFAGQPDASFPSSRLVFDRSGNMYGLTFFGGAYNFGTVYQLTPGTGGWTENVIYSFNTNFGLNAGEPGGPMAVDQTGSLYGIASCGETLGCYYGEVWQLQPSQSGWSLNALFQFNGNNGYDPVGLIRDGSGNLYGPTSGAYSNDSGTIYELSPSNGGWTYSLVHDFGFSDLANGLVMDAAGNIYGADYEYGYGYVFKLTRSGNSWTFTTLHTFSGPDGEFPQGQIVIDSNGNLYGTTIKGGSYGYGVLWEITP